MDEENTRTLFCDDWRGDDERTLGEVEDDAPQPPELISESFERRWDEEDDRAPLPPDVIAASFEAVKPELIGVDGAPVPDPEEQIAASFEGRGDDEEDREYVRQAPDDPVVHAGHDVAMRFHRVRGHEPGEHDERAEGEHHPETAGDGRRGGRRHRVAGFRVPGSARPCRG